MWLARRGTGQPIHGDKPHKKRAVRRRAARAFTPRLQEVGTFYFEVRTLRIPGLYEPSTKGVLLSRRYHHLTRAKRERICRLHDTKIPANQIARQLGCYASTVYRCGAIISKNSPRMTNMTEKPSTPKYRPKYEPRCLRQTQDGSVTQQSLDFPPRFSLQSECGEASGFEGARINSDPIGLHI